MHPNTKMLVATLCGALCTSASAAYLAEAEPNNSFATAQNVNTGFSLDADSIITNSTTIPHVSIRGNGDDDVGQTRDFFRFTLGTASAVLFDIDFGMYDLDSWLNLYDSSGALIGQHDDGGVLDSGTSHGFDSYWNVNLAAGDYVVSVGSFPNGELFQGQDYILHISAAGASVPEPATLALTGLGLAGLAASRRRKAR